MHNVAKLGLALAALVVIAAGCIRNGYGPLPDVIILKDSRGTPLAGATVLPVQEVIAASVNYYSPAERRRRTTDRDGRVRVDLRRHSSMEFSPGSYLFEVAKEGFQTLMIEVPQNGFSGAISVDLVPTQNGPNKAPEPMSTTVMPPAGAGDHASGAPGSS